MGRPILYVPPGGAVFLVTSRTIHGRYLLRPGPRFNRLVLGVVGRAQRVYEMEIHAAVFLSNHYHLLVSPRSAQQLAAFMSYLNGNLAREAGRLHQWKERLWGRRYKPVRVSDEPEAQIQVLRYILEHGCKEDLVAAPHHWPGVHSARALADGAPLEGVWINRTARYCARQRGEAISEGRFQERERVNLSPLPCWSHLATEEYREEVRQLIRAVEQETAARHRRQSTRPLGRRAVRKQHPHDRPKEPGKSPAPRFYCATRSVHRKLEESYFLIVLAYRQAAERIRRGDLSAVSLIPEGCFPPRLPIVATRLAPD